MKITRFNHVGLNADGAHDATRAFYEDVLGLFTHERSGAATHVNDCWSGTDVPILHVVSDPPTGTLEMPNETHVSRFVDDIDEAVAQVKAARNEVLHIGEGNAQIYWFKDPAGNTLELQQDPTLTS